MTFAWPIPSDCDRCGIQCKILLLMLQSFQLQSSMLSNHKHALIRPKFQLDGQIYPNENVNTSPQQFDAVDMYPKFWLTALAQKLIDSIDFIHRSLNSNRTFIQQNSNKTEKNNFYFIFHEQ